MIDMVTGDKITDKHVRDNWNYYSLNGSELKGVFFMPRKSQPPRLTTLLIHALPLISLLAGAALMLNAGSTFGFALCLLGFLAVGSFYVWEAA